jgi:hypothetical protein
MFAWHACCPRKPLPPTDGCGLAHSPSSDPAVYDPADVRLPQWEIHSWASFSPQRPESRWVEPRDPRHPHSLPSMCPSPSRHDQRLRNQNSFHLSLGFLIHFHRLPPMPSPMAFRLHYSVFTNCLPTRSTHAILRRTFKCYVAHRTHNFPDATCVRRIAPVV